MSNVVEAYLNLKKNTHINKMCYVRYDFTKDKFVFFGRLEPAKFCYSGK